MRTSQCVLMFLTLVLNESAELQMLGGTSGFDKPEILLPVDSLTVKCRPRSRLIGTALKENFEYISARIGSSVVLQCHYCNEESTAAPKAWYYSPRENGPDLTTDVEVELGMRDDESKNHFFQRPDRSLVVNNVVPTDTGYYYCHGTRGEEAEHKFNFMVDVINGTTGVVVGNRKDWKDYKSNAYPEVERTLAEKMILTKDPNGHKQKFYFHVIPEWTPWGSCDGCAGLRSKIAECKLVPTAASNIKMKNEHRGVAVTCSTVPSTTPIPPGNSKKLRYLLFEHAVACQSQEFSEAAPDIFVWTRDIKPFVLIESCIALCTHTRRSNQPKFKNTITLQEGDHIKLVCPESSVSSTVEWKKDGLLINNQAVPDGTDHILVDTFSNLYITYARDVESGSYSCYVNGEQIQEVVVSVNAEATRKHAAFLQHMHYLGFMLMFGAIFYVAGIIVAWTQRHSFATIDFEDMGREDLPSGKCREMTDFERKKEFAIRRLLEEKFVNI